MQLHFPLPPSSVIGLPMSGDIEQHHGQMAIIAVVSVQHLYICTACTLHVACTGRQCMQSMHLYVVPALFSSQARGLAFAWRLRTHAWRIEDCGRSGPL